MILPVGANSFQEAMQMGSETYHHLKVLKINFLVLCYSFAIFDSSENNNLLI